jgi:imidazolonepropionase-like amidohydrolase
MGQAYDSPYGQTLKAECEAMMEILPLANKAGVKLLLGDDFGGGVVLPHGPYADELDFYVNMVGIPTLDILRWATRNGAQLMGGDDELGEIKPGMIADLLIIDGDPVADIRVLQDKDNILAILKGGQFEKNQLDRLSLAARPNIAPAQAAE